MAEVSLTWIDQRRFLGIDSSNHTCVFSPMNDIGVKPSDGLLLSLAACLAYDVVDIVHKQRGKLHQFGMRVTGEQASEPPWTYQRIHLQFQLTADGLRQEQLTRAVDLALNRYCSVRASLHPDIEVTFEVALQGSEG